MAISFKNRKAIIFDLFGTLTNGQADPDQRIIDEWSLDVDYDTAAMLVCATRFQNHAQYYSEIIKGLNLPDTDETIGRLINLFEKDLKGEFIEKDVSTFLGRLAQNYRLGIISDIPNPDYNLLKRDGLDKLFEARVFSYESGFLKPDKKIMGSMLDQLQLQRGEVVMIGDSHYDTKLAENSGVDFVLVDKKGKNRDFKGNRVESLDELRGYFL